MASDELRGFELAHVVLDQHLSLLNLAQTTGTAQLANLQVQLLVSQTGHFFNDFVLVLSV